ncbi:Calcineurin-like phosphoesterase superfamily domain-containing protein [Mucilaginibacter pineti]|uniref:Calcineurin-like phosphoesterase superfamily domain-containing protein n=1 Tax=Mucilaginibacter pineti TaxID=1391627 RepID=A0A1G7FPR0_9SPHI|nr:metallophosphoesterase [Mucilaginibacter pineti]SDE77903.1 Calcineurin-like phosphoesterase superfamily domain-containing protein [Mucilaginibacter pineti]
MRRFLQKLLTGPVARFADKISSRPDKKRVDRALSNLYKSILTKPGKKGLVIPFNSQTDSYIILSDQHKGARDDMDIFALAEKNYLTALDHYDNEKFFYINLGDSEELWENLFITIKRHNKATFDAEKRFIKRKAFLKIFGNHDLYWDNDPLAIPGLMQIYGEAIKIYEGAILQTTINKKPLNIYMTHGHQGDLQSDGNWFSKWFVSDIWAPLQAYLKINPNTPANNDQLKTDHNRIMYEWSSTREHTLLITGHTHQPVFKSLTHLEKLYDEMARAKKANNTAALAEIEKQITNRHMQGDAVPDFSTYHPTYFNSGCCCFNDGDITGIEIAQGSIRLIKWEYNQQNKSERIVLDECKLEELV